CPDAYDREEHPVECAERSDEPEDGQQPPHGADRMRMKRGGALVSVRIPGTSSQDSSTGAGVVPVRRERGTSAPGPAPSPAPRPGTCASSLRTPPTPSPGCPRARLPWSPG